MDTPQVNPRKLYVANLAYTVSEDQIREIFSQYGEIVEVRLITDRMSGRSKGFAFVEYGSEDAAKTAMEATNGMEFEGRGMFVTIARPPAPRQDRFGGNGGSNGGSDRKRFNKSPRY